MTIAPEGSYIINQEDMIMAIAFSPDGRYFATAGLDTTARVWELNSGLEVSRINHEDMIVAIAFSPDGCYFATASEDATAQVWEADTGGRVACLDHEDSVNSVAFSPDGVYLVTVTGSKLFPPLVNITSTTTMWQVTTGRKVMYITHDFGVKAFTFSPKGNYLAIATSDHTVAFSSDGNLLATASGDLMSEQDYKACLWRWRSSELMSKASSQANPLSPQS